MRMDPDLLSGRDLDVAVAAEVFGLEVMGRTRNRIGDTEFSCRAPGEDWHRVPLYSSLSASLSLESKLRDLGWMVKRSPFAQVTEPSGRVVATLEGGAAQVQGTGANFEEALARAALRAMA
jgi:hypothetical protein